MNVFRIVRADRVALEGNGAAEFPGRWNTLDVPCVYTSPTPALAQLEVMANVEDWKIFMTVKHVVLRIDVPDDRLHPVPEGDLPAGWADAVCDPRTQEMGASLLNKPEILAFAVPSAVSRTERNVVLNARVTDFEKLVKVEGLFPFEFDERLMK